MNKRKILDIIFWLFQLIIVILSFTKYDSIFMLVVKSLIILYEIVYIIFKTSGKKRYEYLTYFVLLLVFGILYGLSLKTLVPAVHYLYFPTTFLWGCYFYKDYSFDIEKVNKFLLFLAFPFSILLFFKDYISIDSTILIGEVLVMMLPILLTKSKEKKSALNLLSILVSTLAILVLENRMLILMLIMVLFVYFIYCVVKFKEDKISPLVLLLLLVGSILFLATNSNSIFLSDTFSNTIFAYRTNNIFINLACLVMFLTPLVVVLRKETKLIDKIKKNKPYLYFVMLGTSIADFIVMVAFHTLYITAVINIMLCIVVIMCEEKLTTKKVKTLKE